MQVLSILVGIGLMLVASLSYALPPIHEFQSLYPAFAGIIIATVGFFCKRHERLIKYLVYMNGMAAAMVLLWACLRTAEDTFRSKIDNLMLITDVDAICLAGLLIHRMIKEMLASVILDHQENETLRNLETK